MWVLVQGYPVGGYDWGSRPDQGLPPGYGGRPDNSLPWAPGHPGNVLPGYPVDPGWGGGWGGSGRPDQGLPGGGYPGQGHPGNRPPGSWGGRPDQGLPGGGYPGQGLPGQGLPWAPARPDQGLPGEGGNYPSGQPIIPGATPHGSAVATAPPETVNATEGAWVLVNVQGTLVWAWAQKPTEKPPEAGTKPIEPPPAQPKK